MKVLWFANSPCGAGSVLAPEQVNEGWLKSLESEIVADNSIDLAVCFFWHKDIVPTKINMTTYYAVCKQNNSTKLRRLFNRIFNRSPNDGKLLKKLLDVVHDFKPDIIHVHGTEECFGLIQEQVKIPVVISIQSILSPYVLKYFSGIPLFPAMVYEGIKPKLLFRSVNASFKDFKRRAKRELTIFNNAQYIIGRTDWDRRISALLCKKRQYFIGNEILRDSFYTNSRNICEYNGGIFSITTTISSGIYKGFETILRCASYLIKHSSLKFSWTVIGLNSNQDHVQLIERWLGFRASDVHVDLIGLKNEVEVAECLCNTHLYCQVSHIENSPNNVCEASLLGVPVVASFVGGSDSILRPGEDGFLYQDGDAFSLAGLILEISDDYGKACCFANIAKTRAIQRHDRREIRASTISTYRSIVAYDNA